MIPLANSIESYDEDQLPHVPQIPHRAGDRYYKVDLETGRVKKVFKVLKIIKEVKCECLEEDHEEQLHQETINMKNSCCSQ